MKIGNQIFTMFQLLFRNSLGLYSRLLAVSQTTNFLCFTFPIGLGEPTLTNYLLQKPPSDRSLYIGCNRRT